MELQNRDEWTTLRPLPSSRHGAAVVALNENQAVVVGGHNGRNTLNSVVLYDKRTAETSHLPPMNVARVNFCATLVNNKIFVVGGASFDASQIEVLDMDHPKHGWQNINVQLPVESDVYSCTTAVINSTIYILAFPPPRIRILTFDTISQTFSEEVPHLPISCDYMTSIGESLMAWNEEYIYQLCPDEPDAHWRSSAGVMREVRDWVHGASFGIASCGNCAFVVGGYVNDDEIADTVLAWSGSSWTTLPARLSTARAGACAVFLGDDLVVFGGADQNRNILSSVECLFTRQNLYEHGLREIGAEELLARDNIPAWAWPLILARIEKKKWISVLHYIICQKHADIMAGRLPSASNEV